MKSIFSIFIIILFSTVCISQNYQNYNLFSHNSPLNDDRPEPGFILKVRANVHSNLYNNDDQFVKFKIYTAQDEFIIVELEKKEIYKDGSVKVTSSSGEFFEYSDGKFYSGIIKNQPNSIAVFSVFEDRIYGFIQDEDLIFYNLTKYINGAQNEHIYYKEEEVVDFSEYGICGLNGSGSSGFKEDENQNNITRSINGRGYSEKCVKL